MQFGLLTVSYHYAFVSTGWWIGYARVASWQCGQLDAPSVPSLIYIYLVGHPRLSILDDHTALYTVSQNRQPECDSLRNSQPMEFTKQRGYAFWLPHWENQTGGGIQDGLQPVLQLAGDTSKNRAAVVHLADNQCTKPWTRVSKACRDRDRVPAPSVQQKSRPFKAFSLKNSRPFINNRSTYTMKVYSAQKRQYKSKIEDRKC